MYKKITSILLTLALIFGMMSSALPVFAEGDELTYTKVSAIEDGKTYVIVAEGMGMTATPHSGYNNKNNYTYSGFTGTAVTEANIASVVTKDMLWTAEAVNGGFAFKNASEVQYLNAFYEGRNGNNGIKCGETSETWTLEGTKLKHVDTSSSSGKGKYLAWDKDSDISDKPYTGSADLFTIRSSGDTITFYLADGADTDVPGGETPETPVDPPVVPETPGAVNGTFTKVSGLENGKTYVITAENMGMTATPHDGYTNNTGYSYSGFAGTAVTVADNKITSTVTEDMLWTAEAVTGGYAFKNASNDQYLSAFYVGKGANGIEFSTTAQAWTFDGSNLKNVTTTKNLTWDNNVSGITEGSDDFFTIRSSGDTITLYLAEISAPDDTCQHDWADATCTAPKTCTKCNETEGTALGHTWTDATCTAAKTCSVCQATEGEALGHTNATREENRVEATCGANGSYDLVTYCSVCKAVLGTEKKEIPATGDHNFVTETERVASTCKTAGYVIMACGCGAEEKTTLELDKDNHETIVVVNAVDPTCTTPGSTEGRHCTACDTVIANQETVDALNHSFTNYEFNNDATCTEDGTKTAKCDRCDATDTVTAEDTELGHNIVIDEAKAPTCTETGLAEGQHCTRCNDATVAQEEIPATGHTEATREDNRVEASCSADGKYDLVTYCSVCNEVLRTETVTLTATGDHNYATEVERVKSTCTTAGYVIMACGCGETKTTALALDADNHAGGTEIRDSVAETCGKDGYTGDTYCLDCEAKLADGEVIPATGEHSYEVEVTVVATCISEGEKVFTCAVCKDSYKEVITIDANNHAGETEIVDVAVETCGKDGYTGDTYCLDCEAKLADGEVIPATGEHNYSEEVTKVATCSEKGEKTFTCTVCNDVYTEDIEIDADNHADYETEILNAKEADCVNDGYTGDTHCSGCKALLEEGEVIDAAGEHNYSEEVTKVATCSEKGEKTFTCTVCNDEYTESIDVDADNHENVVVVEGKAPTCTEPGSAEGKYCSACEAVIAEQKEVDALGHDIVVTAEAVAPTCTATGLTAASHCSRCDDMNVEQTEVAALGHNIVVTAEAVAPTCTETGLTAASHCSRCDDATVAQQEVAALGHKWVEDADAITCENCGLTEWKSLQLIITADKNSAEPTDSITYTVALTPVQNLAGIDFQLVIPEGLTYVSGSLAEGLRETLNAAACGFNPDNYKVVIGGGMNYTSTEPTTILTFTCTVDNGFTGELVMNVDTENWYFENSDYEILDIVLNNTASKVTVSCPHGSYVENADEKYLKEEADCENKAVYFKSCELCYAASETETFEYGEALGHDWAPATCNASSTCRRCNATTGEPTGHTWTDATCTAPETCSVCGTTQGSELGHDMITVEAVDPTCTTTGLTAGEHCSRCDESTQQSTIPALGHNTVIVDAVAPTCTETGLTEGSYCTRCDETKVQETVPALGHNMVTDAAVAPTCTQTGLTEGSHCTRCDVKTAQEVVPATGHTWADATCTAPETCTVCGATQGVALGHDWMEATDVLPKICNRCGTTDDVKVQLIITADKETAKIGDTITYTVSLGPVYMLAGIEIMLDIPEGLTFRGGELIPGLQQTLNAAACNFNVDAQKVVIGGGMAYTNAEITPVLTFTCTVDNGFVGDILMNVDTDTLYIEDAYGVVEVIIVNDGSKVNVPCAHPAITVHQAVASSCTTPGHAEYSTCNDCGAVVDGSDAPLELNPENHVNVKTHAAVAGTCLVPGHAEYQTCNDCGILVSGSMDEVIDPHGNSRVAEDKYIKTPATCTAAAVYYMSCEHCGEVNTTATFTSGSALGHDMITVPGVAPTCTETGLTEGSRCSRCDEATTQTVVPATGHTWTPATCTEPETCTACKETRAEALGHKWTDATCTTAKTCAVCKATDGEALGHVWTDATCTTAKTCSVCNFADGEALGHDTVIVPGKAATCTQAGLTDGSYCTRCDVKTEQAEIPATGHNWTEATCTTAKTCTVCNVTEGTELGHNMVKVPAVAPTCTTTGLTEGVHCTRCNDMTVEQTVIDALGHDMIKIDGFAPTCTQTGLEDGEYCSRCDAKTEQTVIPVLGHDMVTVPGYAATCTQTGLTDGEYCSRCDAKTEQTTIPVLGHVIVTVPGKAPTCTETGLTESEYCSRCNEATLAQQVVAALGHDMVKDSAVAPTCTQTGLTEGAHCTRCDDATVEQTVLDARGHNFAEATCTVAKTCKDCGATEGSALGHKPTQATCTAPSVCEVCGETVSPANGHIWADATCTAPQTCTVCGEKQGEALGHNWIDASYDAPKTCDRCGAVEGDVLPTYSVSGSVSSFGSATDEITVVLVDGAGNAAYTIKTIGNNATYFISAVKTGTYTMLISKNGHATRAYTVTVGTADVTQNAEIALLGDINFDGKINIIDNNIIYNHILGDTIIADEYAMQCADMNGDGKVDIIDNNLLYDKVMGY